MKSVDDAGPIWAYPQDTSLVLHTLFQNDAPDDRIALSILSLTGAERWSYGKLRDAVLRAARAFQDTGLPRSARILLRLGNTPQVPVAFLGSIAAGYVPIPTSGDLSADELARPLILARPSAIVTDGDVEVPGGLPLIDAASLTRVEACQVPSPASPDTPAYILFTSGTDGQPKAVLHAHRAIVSRQRVVAGWTALGPEDRVLHAGAMNWSYTLGVGLLDPWSMGATALILAPDVPLSALPLLIKRHDVSIFAGVPGHFRQLLKTPLPSFPRLRHALSAGESLPPALRARWRETTGTDIHEAFGQTEISTFLSGSPTRPAPDGAIGYAQPGRQVAILGDDAPVPRGTPGAIAISGDDPGLMLGYVDGDHLTPPPVSAGGWYLTGDTGVMADDGAVRYLGRSDDILTAGGYRISPLDIEDAMRGCPGVEDAAAVDHVTDTGARIVALHWVGDASLSEAALAHHAEMHLARFKRPRLFVRHTALPRSANGKLLRARLRAANEGA